MSDLDLDKLIREMTAERGRGKTLCPSEVARRAAGPDGDWRRLLGRVGQAARRLAGAGEIAIYRKGKVADADTVKGVIRLGLPPDGTD